MVWIVAAFLLLVSAVLWLARNRAHKLIYLRRTAPTQTPSDYGLTRWDDVCFQSADGLKIGGWFVPPASEHGPAIVYAHGIGSNRGDLLRQAAFMAKHGYGALLIDLRNSGESAGHQTTLGYLEPLDIAAAVDYLATRPEVDPDRIGLVGTSLGAASVIRAAAAVPKARAVVAESAYSSLQDNVADGVRRLLHLPAFPFAPLVVYFAERELKQKMDAVRPVDDVGRIAPRALLLIHGSDDDLIHVSNGRRLYEAAGEPKELWIVPGGHHIDLLDVAPDALEQRIVAFFGQYLGVTANARQPETQMGSVQPHTHPASSR
jgi:dipeptidyl aminopeptidase/acylaminoacyl peptidase